MTSDQKAEMARRNGAKSKGPRSAEGKAASSRNALKHGRYAALALETAVNRAVADHEDRRRFLALARRNLQQLGAASAMERDLAIALADTQWRYERLNAAETQVLNYERRDVEEVFQDRLADGLNDRFTVAERDARAVRVLASRGDFLRRITAERTRLMRERAQHMRLFQTLRLEFPQTPNVPERTKERTGSGPCLVPLPQALER